MDSLPTLTPTPTPTRILRSLLASNDVRGALAYLNGRTEYRFTALYRFDQDVLSNRYFFDRENPDVVRVEDVPVLASYCVYVRDGAKAFVLSNSFEDERVAAHSKRETVRSYCGVPLVDGRGQMFGSVCHFDFEPVAKRDADVELLEAVAPLLMAADH